MSTIKHPAASGFRAARYSCESANVSHASPTEATSRFSADRTDGSSSMTKTVASAMLARDRRNSEPERRAAAGIRGGPERAAMSLDDRPAERKADAHPVRFGGEKRI